VNNSKILLLTATMMFGSFSIIKTLTEEEKNFVTLASITSNNAINSCEEFNVIHENGEPNVCHENLDLFFSSIHHIPFIKFKSVFDEFESKITEKIKQIDCNNCKEFYEYFKTMKSERLKVADHAIKAKHGDLTLIHADKVWLQKKLTDLM
jgi:hypothetical protein